MRHNNILQLYRRLQAGFKSYLKGLGLSRKASLRAGFESIWKGFVRDRVQSELLTLVVQGWADKRLLVTKTAVSVAGLLCLTFAVYTFLPASLEPGVFVSLYQSSFSSRSSLFLHFTIFLCFPLPLCWLSVYRASSIQSHRCIDLKRCMLIRARQSTLCAVTPTYHCN